MLEMRESAYDLWRARQEHEKQMVEQFDHEVQLAKQLKAEDRKLMHNILRFRPENQPPEKKPEFKKFSYVIKHQGPQHVQSELD